MELLDVMKNLSLKHSGGSSEQRLFKSVSAEIDGVSTDILLTEYSDKTFLILSQYEKIGCLLSIQKDEIHSPSGSNDIYTTRVIFGATGEEQQVAARFLAEGINVKQPLYLFINLKSYDIETVKACKDIVLDLQSTTTNYVTEQKI